MLDHRRTMKWFGLSLVLIVLTAVACTADPEVIEVQGETIVVEKEVVKEVQVPGETIIVEKEVVKEVQVSGETIVVEKEVVKTVEVPVEKIVTVEVEAPGKQKVLTIGMVGATTHNNWSPMIQGNAHFWQVRLAFSRLVLPDDSRLRWMPDLAERWEVNDDATSYTFFIRENAVWHDGVPVTAKDVAFTYKAHLTGDNGSHIANTLTNIKGAQDFRDGKANDVAGIVLVDDYTIRFDMEFPNSDFLIQCCSDEQNYIVPEHIISKIAPGGWETAPAFAFGGNIIGSGPFKISEQLPDQRVVLEANPDYFFGRPRIDRINFELIPSKDALFVAMQRGDVDIAGTFGVPLEMVDAFIKDPRFSVIGIKSPTTRGVGVNNRVEDLKDPRIRQAFLTALDRKQLIDVFWERNGRLVNTTLTHEWYADPKLNDLYAYDPDKARALLKEAGWDPEREVEMIVYYKGRDDFWAAMQQQLAEVGFKLKSTFVEVPVLVERFYQTYDYDLIFGGWGNPSPFIDLANQYSFQGDNGFGYANDELEVKIDAAKRASTVEEQAEIYREIAAEFTENLPFMAILSQAERVFYNNRFYHPLLSTLTPATSVDNIENMSVFLTPFAWLGNHPELWDIRD